MHEKPFFSVVIPTLNEEKYLPTILKSLGSQTFRDFEVIVIDGRSKDRTKEVFEKFASKLPFSTFVLASKTNVGHQRNLGGEKAKGRYLVFLDADTNIEETFLEEVHVAAVKKKFFLATTWIVPDSDKPMDNLMMFFGNLLSELAKEINKPFAGGYNTIVKKNIFLKLNGFREDIKISEDHDFSIRALKKNIECVILKEPRVTYSLRRFRAEGTLPVLRKYAHGQIYSLLKGPITRELFDYPMGGHVHKVKRRKKVNILKLDKYLRGMEKLEEKITKLLSE